MLGALTAANEAKGDAEGEGEGEDANEIEDLPLTLGLAVGSLCKM